MSGPQPLTGFGIKHDAQPAKQSNKRRLEKSARVASTSPSRRLGRSNMRYATRQLSVYDSIVLEQRQVRDGGGR